MRVNLANNILTKRLPLFDGKTKPDITAWVMTQAILDRQSNVYKASRPQERHINEIHLCFHRPI